MLAFMIRGDPLEIRISFFILIEILFQIDNRLEEEETLKLLASYLELEVNKLPRQAKKFHEACKGSPFNLSLIGAQLAEDKERLNHDSKRWNYYLNKLERKDFFL